MVCQAFSYITACNECKTVKSSENRQQKFNSRGS
uniref:Uncharacterized protein n=1 Tax=Octopus bimaculoides TaxID=37653 RepID=A0A0L8GWQ3_OCTBM